MGVRHLGLTVTQLWVGPASNKAEEQAVRQDCHGPQGSAQNLCSYHQLSWHRRERAVGKPKYQRRASWTRAMF